MAISLLVVQLHKSGTCRLPPSKPRGTTPAHFLPLQRHTGQVATKGQWAENVPPIREDSAWWIGSQKTSHRKMWLSLSLADSTEDPQKRQGDTVCVTRVSVGHALAKDLTSAHPTEGVFFFVMASAASMAPQVHLSPRNPSPESRRAEGSRRSANESPPKVALVRIRVNLVLKAKMRF